MKSYSTKACIMILFLVSMFTVSIAQTDWEKYGGNPVLRPGSLGSWEDYEVYAPFVLKHGDTLKMWYTGSESFEVDHIGYAISTDGISWQKETSNPVLQAGASGSWDSQVVSHPRIILVDTTYHMWYGGTNVYPYTAYRIGYATSPDGIKWTKYPGNPVLPLGDPGEWDSATLAGASYFFDGDTFHVWYGGCETTDFSNTCVGYAKSSDGINWVRYPGNPIFCGSGSWDSLGVYPTCVIVDSSGYKMWYQGTDGSKDRIGYATSSDGINWEALDSFVLEEGNLASWDNQYVAHPHVLLDDITYRMWYSGARINTGNRIGYATAPLDPTGIIDKISVELPRNFVLSQNYPNPFNPITNIEYRIPKSELVSLKVYDVLGREVQILVNENQRAGNHSIQFDAGQLASGVYFYILQAGNEFTETKKMLLIR